MFSWEYLRVAQMYSKMFGTGEGKAIQHRFVLFWLEGFDRQLMEFQVVGKDAGRC